MRAILVHQFGGPKVLACHEVANPVPSGDEILVEVKAAGINPVDTYIRSGHYTVLPELPYTPGFDAAGVVLQTGPDVKHYHPGDRVYVSGSLTGTYAQQALCLSSHLYSLPDNLTFDQGAAVGIPYATAYRALFSKARAVNGETVLIHGASGGVGSAALQLARAAGLCIIASAGSARGLAFLESQGADLVVDHHRPEQWQQIQDFTKGRGVNVILEMSADVNLADDLKALSQNGRVIIIGCRGEVAINPRDMMVCDATVKGMLLMNAIPDERQKIYASLEDGFLTGVLSPVVARSFELAQACSAHEAMSQPGAAGQMVLLS